MIKYYLRRIAGIRPGIVLLNVKKAAAEVGQPAILVFFDMVFCFIRYGIGYIEYRTYSFYRMPAALKKTFLTRDGYRKFLHKVNDEALIEIFNNKALFNQKFADFLHRDWLDLSTASKEMIVSFLTSHGSRYFVKPCEGESGKGISVIDLSDYSDEQSAAEAVFQKKDHIIEEAICQHASLNKLNPDSVNCLRITTFVTDQKQPVVLSILQKIGRKGRSTDNGGSGGMYICVNPETGMTTSFGHVLLADGNNYLFEKHPDYGYAFSGITIPYVKEAADMCLDAALRIPEVRCIGWDVAITPGGPCLVEGNNIGAILPTQYFAARDGKEGLRSVLKKYTRLI